MSNARIKWSSDDAEVLKSFQKQQTEVEKLKKKLDDLTSASKRNAEETKKGMSGVSNAIESGVASIGKWAAGLVSINALTSAVSAEYTDWIENSRRLKDQHDSLHKSIVASLSAAGQLSRAGEFEAAARNVPGATAGQVQAAFAGVQQSAPGLDFARQMELAKQAAPLGALGVDLTTFGQALGDLAEANPDKTAKGIVDLAEALRQMSGEKFAEIAGDRTQRIVSEMQAGGMSGTQALGLFVAGRQANLDPKTMESLALSLASQEAATKAKPGRALTDEKKLRNQFRSTQGASARLSLLQRSPDIARAVLGEGYDTKIGLLTPQAIDAAAGKLAAPGAAAGQLANLPESRAGAIAGIQTFLAKGDESARARGMAEREEVVQVFDRFMQQQGMMWTDRALYSALIRMDKDPEQQAMRTVSAMQRNFAPQDEATQAIWAEMLQHLRNLDAKSMKPGPAVNLHAEGR